MGPPGGPEVSGNPRFVAPTAEPRDLRMARTTQGRIPVLGSRPYDAGADGTKGVTRREGERWDGSTAR